MPFLKYIFLKKRKYIIVYFFCLIISLPIFYINNKEKIEAYNSFKKCRKIDILCSKTTDQQEKYKHACNIRAQCKPESIPLIYLLYFWLVFFVIPSLFWLFVYIKYKNLK